MWRLTSWVTIILQNSFMIDFQVSSNWDFLDKCIRIQPEFKGFVEHNDEEKWISRIFKKKTLSSLVFKREHVSSQLIL